MFGGLTFDTYRKQRCFLKAAEREGAALTVTSTQRNFRQQADLYLQGRTREGEIVTNALPGLSWHNFGRAFDVAFKGADPYPDDEYTWAALGYLGAGCGLKWGGSFGDYPHFENPPASGRLDLNWEHILAVLGSDYSQELQLASSLGLRMS